METGGGATVSGAALDTAAKPGASPAPGMEPLSLQTRAPPPARSPEAPGAEPPLLVLGLFARPPFLCFGSVRLGSSRAALLAIENPNPEPVQLHCESLPEARGFSLERRQLLLQPMERTFVSVRWTPMEEGGVRELITFVTNGIVKHRVILLGKAEVPAKKKKSLWESIKKNNSVPLNSLRLKKKDLNVKTVNKTFSVSKRMGYSGIERVRSPLRSCENVALTEGNTSPPKTSKHNVENSMPLTPLRPLRKEPSNSTCTLSFVRSSTTYSVLCTDTYCESLPEAEPSSSGQNESNLVAKEDASTHALENRLPLSPINPVLGEHHVTCTPSSMRSATYSSLGAHGYRESFQEATTTTIVQDDQFNLEKTLSPQAFVNASVPEFSMSKTPETRILNSLRSPIFTPDRLPFFLTPLSQRRFLSPDSFVNDSYQPDEDVESVHIATILSPDQFVKENLSAIKSAVTQQEYESLLLSSQSSSLNLAPLSSQSSSLNLALSSSQSSSLNVAPSSRSFGLNPAPFSSPSSSLNLASSLNAPSSPSKNSSLILEQIETLPFVTGCVEQDFDNISLESLDPVPSRLTFYVEPKQVCLPLSEINIDISELERAQPKRSQILSATVTKGKADAGDAKNKATNPPKARRCLRSAVAHSDNFDLEFTKVVRFQDLPVIDPVCFKAIAHEAGPVSSDPLRSTLTGRKRKSGEYLGTLNAGVTRNEDVLCTKINKTISPSVKAKKANVQSGNISRSRTDYNQNQRKKAASLALKSSVKTHDVVDASENKFTFRKSIQINSPFQKSTCNIKSKKRVIAVPQSQLTFVKPAKTAIPRHPMPFAAKNMFYDERWKEKQERGFTWWLNFILTPDDLKTDSSRVNAAAILLGADNHHKASVPKAPSKEEMSLKVYTARCRLNRLRRAACRLFTSDSVVKAIKRLELEIEAKRLLVRKDRHLWKDIGNKICPLP